MGHRHMFNAPQVFETDSDQGWNHAEQPYMPIARGASESSSIIHPVDNITSQGGHFPTQWTPAPRLSGHSPSILNGELSHYQPMPPGPSHDPFLHQSAAGNLHMLQNNYMHHPSSSNIAGQMIPGVDGGFYDQAIGSGRGPYKRKSPGIPPICDRGSTSRYYDVGSSSDIHLPADPWQEKQNTESYHMHWEHPPNYGVNSLSIGGEVTMRNVRSRAAVDLENNLPRNHLSSNSVHHSFSSRPFDQPNSVDFWGQCSNAPTREWNRNLTPPAPPGVTFGSDSSFFGHDQNSLNTLNSHPNSSLENGGYNNDVTSRNHVPPNANNHLNQPIRGVRSGYSQRSAPTFRASSSNFRPGHIAASDGGQQMVAESYPSRHPRAASNLRLRHVDRHGRTFVSTERHRSFAEDASFRDRLTPEGLMVVEHSAFYGSRALFDQHRDMRLDIDNMSYEELLALGERIGSVSTGLSDGLISKCLTESIYCSSDLSQDEGTCVICLEEYKNMDDVGTLKVCGHDFHVGCIRKWLSMKNLCPICKASAVDDNMKEK
ncbi:uncharacterized RING finger protein C4G3.12c [Sesamum indicum]|uniref:RING-type E3 ubiquitin transferase n=1 Tax=Sesamum indicum TaxID=4182 RepID=A0A6I9UJZ2_SESIN|nr:uncharacterized RING finger protein C4G3.12c [Sesamum indicum]XP_011094685.1 uncharacterized RING finger protein C4G3.12c [Sesamum indicum]XP_011094686.1 uncharacterized RING finger protein C4G3.12c [Sesamum indicum]XP_011094687.1 uncharacterized RING finger protein C4G3.12c [Sesamum indicum]XP_020553320.1 uncharacterized RING finger protein C4G3.12c [Sesamum indicum]